MSKLTISHYLTLIFFSTHFDQDFLPVSSMEALRVTNGLHIVKSNGSLQYLLNSQAAEKANVFLLLENFT